VKESSFGRIFENKTPEILSSRFHRNDSNAFSVIPEGDNATSHFTSFCQVLIFAQKLSCSKKHHFRKSAKIFRFPSFFLCEPKMNIHRKTILWKTPVDKPVENVENSELSTGISMF